MFRRTLLITTALLMMSAGQAYAASSAPSTAPTAESPDAWHQHLSEILSDTTPMRFVINECVIASATAVTVAALIAGPVGPATVVAAGVVPELSLLQLAGLSCSAGVAAGVASGTIAYVWVDRDVIVDATATQVAYMWQATEPARTAVATAVAGVFSDPAGSMQAAAGTMMASVAGFFEQSRDATGTVIASAASAVGNWWLPPTSAQAPTIDVASAPGRIGDDSVWVY